MTEQGKEPSALAWIDLKTYLSSGGLILDSMTKALLLSHKLKDLELLTELDVSCGRAIHRFTYG